MLPHTAILFKNLFIIILTYRKKLKLHMVLYIMSCILRIFYEKAKPTYSFRVIPYAVKSKNYKRKGKKHILVATARKTIWSDIPCGVLRY